MASPSSETEALPSTANHPTLPEPPNQDETIISAKEILYGVESFYAIVQPVTITMILAALAVIYINTPELQEASQASISRTYNVVGNASNSESTAGQLSAALINGIVIVCAIGVMTFGIVLLYKYRCMKILLGYMIATSALLLGYLSSVMLDVAIQLYGIDIDKISFWWFIYNFGIVGTAAIFYGDGFPTIVGQAYLILTSVIVAWQLSFFDPWTAWVLLVLLALYDLFAVLSPCGPLKALVKLMQQEDAPAMPGLLYEAHLPIEAQRPHATTTHTNTAPTTTTTTLTPPAATTAADPTAPETLEETPMVVTDPPVMHEQVFAGARFKHDTQRSMYGPRTSLMASTVTTMVHDNNNHQMEKLSDGSPTEELVESDSSELEVVDLTVEDDDMEAVPEQVTLETPQVAAPIVEDEGIPTDSAAEGDDDDDMPEVEAPLSQPIPSPQQPSSGLVPMALAKLYKLRYVEDPQPTWISSPVDVDAPVPEPVTTTTYTPSELVALVHVLFPARGGRVVPHSEQHRGEETRYAVYNRHGELKRILFVDSNGKVFEDLRDEEEKKSRNTIKLGLGDFIFYSILVSEAAVYSFTTFAACLLVILTGLGLTLLLLSMYGKALPALPISIFLGVVFYLLTRYLLQPWIQGIFINEVYV